MRANNFWQDALIASEALADEIEKLIEVKIASHSQEEGNFDSNEIKENIKGILLALLTLKNEVDEEQ